MMADRTTALGALQFPCTLAPVPVKSKQASPCSGGGNPCMNHMSTARGLKGTDTLTTHMYCRKIKAHSAPPLHAPALLLHVLALPFMLKPLPFMLKPLPFMLQPLPFMLKPLPFMSQSLFSCSSSSLDHTSSVISTLSLMGVPSSM